ncbi:MAG: GGDEF domain-containing protein [Candidatus Omnitrophota bacterium]
MAEEQDYVKLPLKIDTEDLGYLAVSGLDPNDINKFHILAQQFLLGIKRAVLYKKVQELAITDSLTQVFSRRYFLERFKEELERSKKYKHLFSFFMIDIDDFKSYNDRYGHLVGDAVLREIAKAIKENIRQVDLVGRYGGEEFSLILPETGKDQALVAAERIRQAVECKLIKVYDEDLRVTISIGISAFPKDGRSCQTIIERADQALYHAKQTGKNKTCNYAQ